MGRLWSGMRYPSYRSKYSGEYDIAQAVQGIGLELTEAENKSRYNSQMAAAKAQKIRLENQLWSDLDQASPDDRKSIYDKYKSESHKSITDGMSGVALRDIQNDLKIYDADLEGRYEKWSKQRDSQDNVINFNAALTEYDNTDAKDPVDLTQRCYDLEGMALNMMDTGDHPDLQTPDQVKEFLDKKESSWLTKYLLNNPHKTDEDGKVTEEDYWINHPNEFAKERGIGTNLDRDLLTAEEMADLKRQYKSQKQLQEYELKTAREQKENETLDSAFNFAEQGDFRGGINEITNARAELGSDSFIDALNKYQNAFRILNTTGNNVYKETQNWELYWDDYQKAIDGEIKESELRKHVGENGYSVAQFKEIKGIIDGTSSKGKGFEDTKAAKDLIDMIDYNFNTIGGGPEQQKYLHNKGLRLLKESITEDMDAKDKLLEAVRISRALNKELESGMLSEELEQGLTPKKGPLYSKLKSGGFIPPGVKVVNTLEEAAKLKKGTEFYYLGQVYKRK